MKQNDKQNIVAAIQKNLRIMQEEAQNYIQKHHTNLPPLCSARHYLFHSLSKRNTIDIPSIHKKVIQENKEVDNNQFGKATIYNVEFRKKSLEYRYSAKKDSETSRTLLNSTSMKVKVNGGWKPHKSSIKSGLMDKSDQKIKTIVMNSQIVGLNDNDSSSNYNAFSPKMSKMDLSKKQAQMIEKYHSRFRETKKDSPPKNQKKNKSITDLQTLNPVEDILDSQLILNMQPIRRRRLKVANPSKSKLTINYSKIINPQKELIAKPKKPRLNQFYTTRKPNKPKQYLQEFTPWEFSHQQRDNLQQYVHSADF